MNVFNINGLVTRHIAGEDSGEDNSSGTTEGCDDVDELDDDDDDVSAFDQSQADDEHLRHQQTGSSADSEMARLANIGRDCAVFMADFVQKIFDPSWVVVVFFTRFHAVTFWSSWLSRTLAQVNLGFVSLG